VYLISIYDKSDFENISTAQLKNLIKILQFEIGEQENGAEESDNS
jgi:hypothetical protein